MRLAVTVLVLWTLANVVFSARLLSPRAPSDSTADGRTPIALPLEARDAVLLEMRTMLASVQGVLDGAARSDTAAIRAAAAASGVVMAADPALEEILPRSFLQMGMATHAAFDTLAMNAASGATAAVDRLARITATCVSCHSTYRIEAR
ncbi:MAG: hypothetical protein R2909_03665 [Gemmatimonadales bacterium]